MNILIVGNILNDIYLNLDSRTEKFETDKNNTKWLDISFDASEHHYFNRESSLSGSAVTLEVMTKMGLSATINDSDLNFNSDTPSNIPAETCRYILISEGNVSYLTPTTLKTTNFVAPSEAYDYLYIDRSAELNQTAINTISAYLDISPQTKLVVYYNNASILDPLLARASLIFHEKNDQQPETSSLNNVDPHKIIKINEDRISSLNISENISTNRIDMFTHLSAYSILSATILSSFILGNSIEDSFKLARLNLENSKLNSALSLEELQSLAETIKSSEDIELIAKTILLYPKGILAADESGGSIHKKFEQLNIPDTYDNRRNYRNIFFTTPNLENYINAVILFDETARQQADNSQNFVDYLTTKRIIPGIKVDQGLEKYSDSTPANYDQVALPAHPDETWTKGLDDLPKRLQEYYQMGLRFAKWRAAFEIRSDDQGNIITPTDTAIEINCNILAKYAKDCQEANIVPIVEPELVYDGDYSIEQNAEITSKILDCLFNKLQNFGVNLRTCILKCNMVLAGKKFTEQSTPEEVGAKTANVLKSHVPEELAGVVFLSGGQTVEQATNNLANIIKNGPFPWPVTFSFARALQDPALYAWQGDNNNKDEASKAFLDRLIANTNALK